MLSLVLPLLFSSEISTALALVSRQTGGLWGGVNITQQVLNVQSAISSPTCAASSNCTEFVRWIPQCFLVGSDPACWCANPSPLHYCAICMSSPQNAETSAEQTQAAGSGHDTYHVGCGAYFDFVNGTSSSSSSTTALSTASATSSAAPAAGGKTTSNGLNTGALAGIVVGGVVGLALIISVAWLVYRNMQNKHEVKVTSAATPYGGGMDDYVHTPFLMDEMTLVPQPVAGISKAPSPPPSFHPYSANPQGPTGPASLGSGHPNSNPRDSALTYDASILGGSSNTRGVYR